MRFMPILVGIAATAFLFCSGEKDPIAKQSDAVRPVETNQDTQSITAEKEPIIGHINTNSHPLPVKPDSFDSAK